MPITTEHLKLALWVESLRCGDALDVKVQGTSMLPSVWPGDFLTIHKIACEEYVPGDIVLVLRDNRFFIHRLVDKLPGLNGYSWITKGDAMDHNDPPAAEPLGRVARIRRDKRSFAPSRRVSLARSAVAWILRRSDRLRNLVLRIHAQGVEASLSAPGRFARRLAVATRQLFGFSFSRSQV